MSKSNLGTKLAADGVRLSHAFKTLIDIYTEVAANTNPASALPMLAWATADGAAAAALVSIDADGLTIKPKTKAGTANLKVIIELAGYKSPTTVKMKAKVTNAAPKLKLSQKSVKLLPGDGKPAKVSLLSGNSKVPFETDYSVTGVALSPTDAKGRTVKNALSASQLSVSYYRGVISVTPLAGCKPGTAMLKFTIAGTPADSGIYLPLNISMLSPAGVTPSAKTKAASASTSLGSGVVIAEIPISINAVNHTVDDWEIVSARKGSGKNVPFGSGTDLDEAIEYTAGDNAISLSVKDPAILAGIVSGNKGKDVKFTLNIGSPGILKTDGKTPKTFAVALTVTGKAPTFTLAPAKKDKLDVINPNSGVGVTVNLKNITSKIESVELFERLFDTGSNLTDMGTEPSRDFIAETIADNRFRIRALHNNVTPNITQNLSVKLTLKNGESLTSWVESGGVITEKPHSIKPVQTKAKASQSKKAVTLYSHTPLAGESLGLSLTAPAGVKLKDVSVNQASVNKLNLRMSTASGDFDPDRSDVFVLRRNGENTWTLHFTDGMVPVPVDKFGNRLKNKDGSWKAPAPRYNIKLDLWAEGAIAPTPVNVTVNIK